jgi:hypothetical protein
MATAAIQLYMSFLLCCCLRRCVILLTNFKFFIHSGRFQRGAKWVLLPFAAYQAIEIHTQRIFFSSPTFPVPILEGKLLSFVAFDVPLRRKADFRKLDIFCDCLECYEYESFSARLSTWPYLFELRLGIRLLGVASLDIMSHAQVIQHQSEK